MMKPLILTLSAAAWLLSACSADDGAVPTDNPAPVGMQVLEASMNDLQPASRAGGKATITEGSIGVFLNNISGGTDYDTKNNVCYTAEKDANNGTVVWNSDDALFFNTSIANVCAYYPYVNDAAYADSKKIPLTTQVYDAAYDLSYATNIPMNATQQVANGSMDGAGCQVSFSMKHAYALLELNLTRGNLKDDVTISKIEIAATGLNASNTLDITSGSYGSATALPGKAVYIIEEELTLLKGGTLTKPVLLIVPMTTTGNPELKFTFTLKNTGNPTMSATINSIKQFEKAKKYIVNLSVNGTGLDASSVTILPWKEVSVTNSSGGGSFIPLP